MVQRSSKLGLQTNLVIRELGSTRLSSLTIELKPKFQACLVNELELQSVKLGQFDMNSKKDQQRFTIRTQQGFDKGWIRVEHSSFFHFFRK